MYIYFKPSCGFNDDLSRIMWLIYCCEVCHRTLLLDGERGTYEVDYSKLMTFPSNIICDTTTIDRILKQPMIMLPFINCNLSSEAVQEFEKSAGNHPLVTMRFRNIGSGYPLFRRMGFLPIVKAECQRRKALLGNKYLCIQVRNTDRKCDYTGLYEANREAIHSYPAVYVATDSEEVLTFFGKQLPVKNFATFPSDPAKNLHKSTIPGMVKFMDMICDLYLLGMADQILSNSKGGYIKLAREMNENKQFHMQQFS
jgi:hypothetical protein